jgi:hypothetical protein
MAGYLDEYGVAEARRGRIVKFIILGVLAAAVVGTAGFFYFRNWSEERVVAHFLDLLRQKNYQEAYKLWETPESKRFYPIEKFNEDWGPSGIYKNPDAIKIANVDACEGGVVFTLAYPGLDDAGIWVDRQTKVMSFYAEPRCIGPHWQWGEFFRRVFGKSGS